MTGQVVMNCMDAVYDAIKLHKEELATLDQAIGDGDHVFNLLRGLQAIETLRPAIETEQASTALSRVAAKLLATIGGSSGPLFSSLLSGMAKAMPADSAQYSATDMARVFAAGVAAVQQRAKTGKGSKTMMDVLIPISERLQEMAAHPRDPTDILLELPKEAHRCMLSTRDMVATKGRASYLGERSRGHIDPGARSCQIMIAAVCAQLLKLRDGEKDHEKISE